MRRYLKDAMHSLFIRITKLHTFLQSHALYPVLLSTVLTGILFVLPALQGDRFLYRFLPWNLFLAWVPYLVSLLAAYWHERWPRRWVGLLIPGVIWLAFFPNAPYLVTDFIHLRTYYAFGVWREIVLMVSAVWTGLFLAIFSLRTMQGIVKDYAGSIVSWLFVMLTFFLSGLGVYIGRYLRLNSWDLFADPLEIIALSQAILNPAFDGARPLVFVLQMSALMLVCYVTLLSTRPQKEA